jgi:hypothetical protein
MREPTTPEFAVTGPGSKGWRKLINDLHWSLYNTWRSLSTQLRGQRS